MSRADDPFDTYLLRVLTTLIAERSVSRTAIRLGQSQPAISAALRRLREIAGDPLVVRDKGEMVPTARAIELGRLAHVALDEIEAMHAPPDSFDAGTSTLAFTIGSPDFLSVHFQSRVARELRRQAPRARLSVHPLGVAFDYEQALASGEIDVVIGNWPEPPSYLHLDLLLEDDIVCLVANDHPFARGPVTADDYLAAAHVVPVPYSVAHRGVVESHLATLRVKRNAAIMIPFFNAAPYLLPGTDLVFTTSRHFAQYYAKLLPLAIVASPIAFPRMRFYQLWHERSHDSPAHRWLRGLLAEAGGELSGRGA